AATENLSAGLLDHLMNMHQASGPRMPRIKKLVLSVSAHAVRERPAVSGAIEVELGRRTWPGAKGEAFTPPFLRRRLPGSILPSRARANEAAAALEGIDKSYVSRLLPLAFLSPDIVQAIVRGSQPAWARQWRDRRQPGRSGTAPRPSMVGGLQICAMTGRKVLRKL